MDQVFNELSANASYKDKYAASLGMQRMLRLSFELGDCGYNRVMRVVETFSQLLIAPGYSIAQWARDKTIGADRDLQRYLLISATQAPYVEQFIAYAEQDLVIEFSYKDQPALGLGLAYVCRAP